MPLEQYNQEVLIHDTNNHIIKQPTISSGIREATRNDQCYLLPSGTVGIYLAFSIGTTTLAQISYKI